MKPNFLVACLLFLSGLTMQAQVVQNPSFEDAGTSPDTAAHWNRWGNWINREVDWAPTHSGSCMIGYHHWQLEDVQTSGIWQDISNVKAGQRFTFSIWMWVDQSNFSASKVELRLEAIADDKAITIESVNTPIKGIHPGEWHQLKVTGTTPKDNLRVLVILTPATGTRDGAIKFDDAALEPVNNQQTKIDPAPHSP